MQCFARKLLHLPNSRTEAIQSEVRALQKLCNGASRYVIKLFDSGEFRFSEYYFIDMELCDLSLQAYLYPSSPAAVSDLGFPPFIKDLQLDSIVVHILDIMWQITAGLMFIHDQAEAHRDLKPSNGLFPLYCVDFKVFIHDMMRSGN